MKQLKIKQKEKGGFIGILLGTLGASLLGNLLTGKGTIRAGKGAIETIWGATNRAGKDIWCCPIL